MSHVSNEQLIAQYLKGEEKALEILIRNNLAAVYNLVYRYVPKKDEAEDLTQEAFIKAWKNIKKYKTDYKFKTWIFTIARNVCLDFLKKKNRPVPFSELENKEENFAFEENIVDESPLVLAYLQKEEGVKELNFALEEIPAAYRQALRLRHDENLKFREIAALLKEPLDTVKTRYRRAVEKLRKIWKEL